MGVLSRAFGRKSSTSVWDRYLQLLDNGHRSGAGPSVNLTTATRVSSAFACMRVISQGGAQLPFKLYQTVESDGLPRIAAARKHPAYDVVSARPNGWQTAFEFLEQLLLHASLGNAYAYKGIYRGKVSELILLNPCAVRAEQSEDWTTTYQVRGKSGVEVPISSDLIWHVRGPSWDGFLGIETLNVAREALGLSIALDESLADLHANGIRPSGVYSVDGTLSPDQHEKLTAWVKKEAAANAGGTLILDRGTKWLSQTMSSVDAQHREMRQHQIEEVCRFFGVLPIMIGYTGDKASTYASAEAMFTAHKVNTLAPWLRRIEQSADINLLTEAERKAGYYFKFTVNALLHATSKDQAEYFAKALGAGGSPAWMAQDEVRAFLELDPMGGPAAKLPPLLNQTPAPAPQS